MCGALIQKKNIMKKKSHNIYSPAKELLFRLLFCFADCFLLGFIMNQYKWSMPIYTGLLSLLFIFLAVAFFIITKRRKEKESVYRIVLIDTILFFVLFVIFKELTLIFPVFPVKWQIIVAIVLSLLVGINCIIVFLYYKTNKIEITDLVYLLGFFAFLFRAMYALFNPIINVSRQHDTIAFTNGGGHLGYIWQIWAYGKNPDVDPRTLWEFYQPPFYYLICGYWVKIYTLLRVPIAEAAENIQLFSLFCVTGTGIVLDEIVKCLCDNRNRIIAAILFAVCPLFTYLAGSVNNDALLLFMFSLSVFAIIHWFKTLSWKWIIVSAVFVGLSTMTKISGSLIAPAILFLFVVQIVKNKNKRAVLFGQYVLFGFISLPLGLWWNVRNVLKFQMPFFWFNPANTNSIQYIPDYSAFQRLFGLHNQLNHLYVEIFNTSENVDYNIILTTFKTIVFTCSSEINLTVVTQIMGTILFILSVIIVIVMLILGIYNIIRDIRNEKNLFIYHIFMALCVISYLIFYIRFIFSEPFVHTMHARYIMPAIFIWILSASLNNSDALNGVKNRETICAIFFSLDAVVLVIYITIIALLTYRV